MTVRGGPGPAGYDRGMHTFDTTAALLAAIDALDLPRGTWVATDADGTLWAADVADLAWHRLLGERAARPAAAGVMRRLLEGAGRAATGEVHADAAAVYDLYRQDVIDDRAMVLAMTACWAGWRPEDVRAFGARLAREVVLPRAYATTGELLRGLLARGLQVAVVSGSPRLLVEEAVGGLGLPARPLVVGAETGVEGGVLGDRLLEPTPWEEGKVDALRARAGVAAPVAMGDTLGDLALLEAADRLRVLVHPRPALRERARGAPWALFAPGRTVSGEAVAPPASNRTIQGPGGG